ncbi:TPA: SEC10/PgrA surface exclusion domain-containing protein [Streptococcus suis]|nr:SEC10/PgrA surface exclusion domain-containing protein [Streptococcus suis]
MNKKTLKTLATGAAITLATVGASNVSANTQYGIQLNRVTGEWQTVNNATGEIVKSVPHETYSSYEEAEASLLASTVETPVANETPATETNTVEAPKTAAEVQSEVDAQQAVVDATATEAGQAQAEVNTANQEVSNAQSAVDTATQAVTDAEANAAKATPENIAANQADQTANLADQTANAAETDQVNAEITAQTQAVADAQTAVDTAQAEKDQADATVASKEADVKAAQDALSGTGLAEAQATLDQATADVKTAQDNVATATTAVDTAKKADADRQTKIDAATTDVAVKTDAVDTAKAKLTTAQDTVKTTTDAVSKATDAVKSATDALANVDTVTIADLTQFKADKASGDSDFMTDSGATAIEQSSTKIGEDDKNEIIDVNNLTEKQLQNFALYNLQIINAIRKQFGVAEIPLTTNSMNEAKTQIANYIKRDKPITGYGHISNDTHAENATNVIPSIRTMYDLKEYAYNFVTVAAFADAPSNWGHSANILSPNTKALGVGIGTFGGQLHIINMFDWYSKDSGTPITNPNDPATLQAALTQAQAALTAAQTASDEAKAKLTQASSDYATALEAKTQAEKVLADATATPLQTQVAENNLRLANIALQNAENRKADAQKAVDNFSANLAEKKAALDTAKAELATAQATATAKAEALKTAQANLASQQATLDSLNKERAALLAEKDRLVEEAKALAEELNGYLNAPAILADAQATLTAKQAALTDAQAKAETAQTKLETVTAKLNEENAKLAELQAEYEVIKDLEDKAKDNIIATLPDGTVVAVPKTAPTVDAKPAIDVDLVKDAVAKGQDVKVVDGKVVVADVQAGVTVTPQGITYSRVERAKALPNTGEQTSLLALAGVTALSSLGLASARRKRK